MKPDVQGRQRLSLHNRIAQKSADFLVCLKDFTVVGAVELDDATHSARNDANRDELLHSAGIEVVRVHVNNIPSIDTLRDIFTGPPRS